MKTIILTGLLLTASANTNAQEIVQINQQSFDLIKSALIRILKENKELQERINDLENKTKSNTDNLVAVSHKIETITMGNINAQYNPILNALDNGKKVKARFKRDSNVRIKAGLKEKIIKRFNAGDTTKVIYYQKIGNNIWYELEQGFTHFHNVELVKEIPETQITQKVEAKAQAIETKGE